MKLSTEEKSLHQEFTEYGKNAREWMRKCVLLLPEIERKQLWKKKGFSSIYEYAAKLAGMSRETVKDALRILNKVEDKPLLQRVIEQKGLNRVRPILGIVTAQTEQFWAEKALTMSKNTLETYVKNYSLEARTSTQSKPVKINVGLELHAAVAIQLETLKKHSAFEAALEEFLLTFAQEVRAEQPKAVLTGSRHIPATIKRHVGGRTGGLCAFPSCSKKTTSFHHTQRWKSERVHDPARLHALCTAHERLAHQGLIEHEEEHPSKWRILHHADPVHLKRWVDEMVLRYRPT